VIDIEWLVRWLNANDRPLAEKVDAIADLIQSCDLVVVSARDAMALVAGHAEGRARFCRNVESATCA